MGPRELGKIEFLHIAWSLSACRLRRHHRLARTRIDAEQTSSDCTYENDTVALSRHFSLFVLFYTCFAQHDSRPLGSSRKYLSRVLVYTFPWQEHGIISCRDRILRWFDKVSLGQWLTPFISAVPIHFLSLLPFRTPEIVLQSRKLDDSISSQLRVYLTNLACSQ